jgi:carbonic anhydrase
VHCPAEFCCFELHGMKVGSFSDTLCLSYTVQTEGVQWVLLRNPIYIFGDDAKAIHALLGENYRPTQPLNGRVVGSTV